jgi:hypothetical protein
MDIKEAPLNPLLAAEYPDTASTKIARQAEVRLWRATCDVTYLDSEVYDLSGSIIDIPSPLPVTDDQGRKIGFASVAHVNDSKGDRLVAQIAIDYATEERFLTELSIKKLYPRLYGRMGLPMQPLFDFDAKLLVVRLKLDGIQLSALAPLDSRIKHLSDTSS